MSDEPVFTRHGDGVVSVDREYPPQMLVTRELIEDVHPAVMQRAWRTLTFTTVNRGATYRIARRNRRFPRVYECERTDPASRP